MELFEAITFVRKEKNMKISELSEKSGVPINTLKKILSGISDNPQLSTVRAIAHALDCTIDDLVYYDSKPRYTLSEQQLIKKYRLLNADGKQKVDMYIDDLLKIPTYQRVEEKQYKIKIAARNGTFEERIITDSDIEKINALPDVDDIDL